MIARTKVLAVLLGAVNALAAPSPQTSIIPAPGGNTTAPATKLGRGPLRCIEGQHPVQHFAIDHCTNFVTEWADALTHRPITLTNNQGWRSPSDGNIFTGSIPYWDKALDQTYDLSHGIARECSIEISYEDEGRAWEQTTDREELDEALMEIVNGCLVEDLDGKVAIGGDRIVNVIVRAKIYGAGMDYHGTEGLVGSGNRTTVGSGTVPTMAVS